MEENLNRESITLKDLVTMRLMPHYGGIITEEEWADEDMEKYVIRRLGNEIDVNITYTQRHLLAFHTWDQRDDFLDDNPGVVDLILFQERMFNAFYKAIDELNDSYRCKKRYRESIKENLNLEYNRRWRDANRELPLDNQVVLVKTDESNYFVAEYSDHFGGEFYLNPNKLLGSRYLIDDIVLWKPII